MTEQIEKAVLLLGNVSGEMKAEDYRRVQQAKEILTKLIISTENIPYKEIISYLNKQTGSSFREVEKTKRLVKTRWLEGYTEENFYTVIDNKVVTWINKPDFRKYLRPETLFGTKFESYLNERPSLADRGIMSKGTEETLRNLDEWSKMNA